MDESGEKEMKLKKCGKRKKREAVVASGKTSKPLPMDESGEKEMKLQMLLLSLKDLLSGCGEGGRTIVNGYDTKLLQDVVETALTKFASPSQKNEEEAVVASDITSKPLPMDESVEKEMKSLKKCKKRKRREEVVTSGKTVEKEMKLLSVKERNFQSGYAVPGSGVVRRIIVWGYDTSLPHDVVETALINLFSNCGMITGVCIPEKYGSGFVPERLYDISYIYFFTGEGAVDNALLLNGTDVGGWTVYVKPYPFRPVYAKPMVWLTVEGCDTSVSKIEIKRELIQLFSSCGEVDECDVHVFKSGSADLIVKGEDAAEKVPKLNGSFMGHNKLVLRNVCYGDIQIDFRCGYALRSGYAVPGCGEVGRIIVRGYDKGLPQDVVERALINHFSSCGRITDVCVHIYKAELFHISYIYFVGEGAVDKALDLNGTDVGGWTVNVKAYPFRLDAKRIVWLTVKGFDTSLSNIDIKRALIKHFSWCGEVDESDVHVYKSSADLVVTGEDAAEKVPKLDGSFMGHHKLVLRNVCYRHIETVHRRPLRIYR